MVIPVDVEKCSVNRTTTTYIYIYIVRNLITSTKEVIYSTWRFLFVSSNSRYFYGSDLHEQFAIDVSFDKKVPINADRKFEFSCYSCFTSTHPAASIFTSPLDILYPKQKHSQRSDLRQGAYK